MRFTLIRFITSLPERIGSHISESIINLLYDKLPMLIDDVTDNISESVEETFALIYSKAGFILQGLFFGILGYLIGNKINKKNKDKAIKIQPDFSYEEGDE